ncbi:hypothetical protein ACULLL_16515 [Lysinibacillus irui]|uniref:hypothetical protein n=1 Tax=Lysinibacillus irui TaxID=2998077 RepID=UPI004043AE99
MAEKQIKVFSVYKLDENLEGTITKMDANTKLIHIKDKYLNIHKVHFLDILSISDTELVVESDCDTKRPWKYEVDSDDATRAFDGD